MSNRNWLGRLVYHLDVFKLLCSTRDFRAFHRLLEVLHALVDSLLRESENAHLVNAGTVEQKTYV